MTLSFPMNKYLLFTLGAGGVASGTLAGVLSFSAIKEIQVLGVTVPTNDLAESQDATPTGQESSEPELEGSGQNTPSHEPTGTKFTNDKNEEGKALTDRAPRQEENLEDSTETEEEVSSPSNPEIKGEKETETPDTLQSQKVAPEDDTHEISDPSIEPQLLEKEDLIIEWTPVFEKNWFSVDSGDPDILEDGYQWDINKECVKSQQGDQIVFKCELDYSKPKTFVNFSFSPSLVPELSEKNWSNLWELSISSTYLDNVITLGLLFHDDISKEIKIPLVSQITQKT